MDGTRACPRVQGQTAHLRLLELRLRLGKRVLVHALGARVTDGGTQEHAHVNVDQRHRHAGQQHFLRLHAHAKSHRVIRLGERAVCITHSRARTTLCTDVAGGWCTSVRLPPHVLPPVRRSK
eukprot:1727207-Prymnesium_polylepis.1